MNILQLLASSSFITLNKNLIRIFGIEEAAIVGIFASVHHYNESICEKQGIEFDGWFYKTYEDIEDELGLSKHIASKAIENLIKNRILIDKKKGVPCLRYFKFQEIEFFNSLKLKNLTPRNQKNELQEVQKFNSKQSNNSLTSSQGGEPQEVKKFNGNKNTNKNISFSSAETAWEELKERERYDFEIDLEKARGWYNDQGNMKISFINFLKKWVSKPENQLKKTALSISETTGHKLSWAEEKEIKEIRTKIKFELTKAGFTEATPLFMGPIEKDGEAFVIKVKHEKALKYQDILNKINVKIEI